MKALDGLRWKPKWTSHLGCLAGCLDYLGVEVPDAWLFGGTGHAFVMNVHEVVCPSGPTAWNTEMVFRLGHNLGYAIDGVSTVKSDGDFAEKQALAWEHVRKAIGDGLPCYGWELHIPEYYVVHGFDDVGYYFNGPLCDEGKGPKPWRELGTSEIGVIELCSVRRSEAKDDASADEASVVKQALEFAVAVRNEPKRWAFPLYAMGLEAYDAWIGAIEQGKAHGMGTAYNSAVWAECRHYAREFLDEARLRLDGARGGQLGQAFDAALEAYGVVADDLKALAELFPFAGISDEQKDHNVQDPANCVKAVVHLRSAKLAEQHGLNALEQIAAAL